MSDAGAAAEVQRGGEPAKANAKPEADKLTPLLVLLAVVVSVWIGYWVVVSWIYATEQSRGLFGDMFGGINALFSAAAFAGLIYTVLLQRKELRLQREELSQTRKELRGQRVQLEVQSAVLRLQAFENTFFEMMKRHEEIVNAIEVQTAWNDPPTTGRRAFRALYEEFRADYREVSRVNRSGDPLENIQTAYNVFFAARQSEVGHYFRNLYHLVKLVSEMDVLVPQRKRVEGTGTNVLRNRRYSALIRAQLSSFEHLLLFYNGLSEFGIEKFKPLIERFALLENMPLETLAASRDLALYEPAAFGDMKVPATHDVD